MTSIRSLVDTFGPPPSEVCLDWAYQIKAAAIAREVAEVAIESRASGAAAPSDAAHWTSLEVAEDGSLRLDGLNSALARQALEQLPQWLAADRAVATNSYDLGLDAARREIPSSAESFRACDSVDPGLSDCGRFRHRAPRKRGLGLAGFSMRDRRLHLTGAGVVIAALGGLLIYGWIGQNRSTPAKGNALASGTHGSDATQAATSASATLSARSPVDDFLPPSSEGDLTGPWTTSDQLTEHALSASSTEPDLSIASSTSDALGIVPPPALSVKLSAPAQTVPATSIDASEGVAPSDVVREAEPAAAADAESGASTAIGDVMSQVASAARQVELASAERNSAPPSRADQPTADALATKDAEDGTRQPSLMLSRDAMSLRPATPRGLARRLRELHWKARIELTDDFLCEPAAVQTVDARTGAQWRIYAKDAKSPRACVIVSVRRRSPREPDLEWSVRGGAEDVPELRLPLARKWLDALAAQLQLTAAGLRSVVDSPAPQVPRELRSQLQNQRQLGRQQLAVAERLLGLLAEIDQLAAVLDDQLVGHAELRESPDGPLVLCYGSCKPDEQEPASEPARSEPAASESVASEPAEKSPPAE